MSVIFDVQGALDRVADDKELLLELFHIAFADAQERFVAIEEAISSKDTKKVENNAHAMKSAFGNIGAMACHAVSFSLERAAKNNEVDKLATYFSELKQQYQIFKEAAEKFRVDS